MVVGARTAGSPTRLVGVDGEVYIGVINGNSAMFASRPFYPG